MRFSVVHALLIGWVLGIFAAVLGFANSSLIHFFPVNINNFLLFGFGNVVAIFVVVVVVLMLIQRTNLVDKIAQIICLVITYSVTYPIFFVILNIIFLAHEFRSGSGSNFIL